MANGATHQLAGAVAGIAVCATDNPDRATGVHHPLAAGAIGAALGKLPDMIEPAIHPHHRQFFHSVVVAAGLVAGMRKLYQWEPEDGLEKVVRSLLLVGGAAYLSHLALDALTSRSLPLVGKI